MAERSASNNEYLEGITNVDQGPYQNAGSKKITGIPTLDLAYLTNNDNGSDVDNTVLLNPSYLTWSDFLKLFYATSGCAFGVSPGNENAAPISFFGQTYETTQNKKTPFSLSLQVIKAWSKKNNKPESSVPIPSKIQLERQKFLIKSLAFVNAYQLGLSLDEAISTLLSRQEIQPADYESSATVKFTINYRNNYNPLDTNLLIVFTFVTNIPGYINTDGNNPFPPYSNENPSVRKTFVEVADDISGYGSTFYEQTHYGEDNSSFAQHTILGEESVRGGASVLSSHQGSQRVSQNGSRQGSQHGDNHSEQSEEEQTHIFSLSDINSAVSGSIHPSEISLATTNKNGALWR
jgi:hypothetical protein